MFIILPTLRLDFLLSTFTGLVAAVELFAIAMLYHPVGTFAEAAQEPGYNIVRSILLVVGSALAGAVGLQLRRQFESSIAAATARPRHQFVRAARLAASGGTAAGGRSRWHQRGPPCRHYVRRFLVILRERRGCARRQEVVGRLDGVRGVGRHPGSSTMAS
jgi:hypothetical protein